MSLDTAIQRFRQRQERLFRSKCVITRGSQEAPTVDPDTLEISYGDATLIYSGPCQFRPGGRVGSDVQAGETEVRLSSPEGKLPANTAVRKDDLWTMTASKWDQDLVGKVFRITDVLNDDRQIARVCVLEEVT